MKYVTQKEMSLNIISRYMTKYRPKLHQEMSSKGSNREKKEELNYKNVDDLFHFDVVSLYFANQCK